MDVQSILSSKPTVSGAQEVTGASSEVHDRGSSIGMAPPSVGHALLAKGAKDPTRLSITGKGPKPSAFGTQIVSIGAMSSGQAEESFYGLGGRHPRPLQSQVNCSHGQAQSNQLPIQRSHRINSFKPNGRPTEAFSPAMRFASMQQGGAQRRGADSDKSVGKPQGRLPQQQFLQLEQQELQRPMKRARIQQSYLGGSGHPHALQHMQAYQYHMQQTQRLRQIQQQHKEQISSMTSAAAFSSFPLVSPSTTSSSKIGTGHPSFAEAYSKLLAATMNSPIGSFQNQQLKVNHSELDLLFDRQRVAPNNLLLFKIFSISPCSVSPRCQHSR